MYFLLFVFSRCDLTDVRLATSISLRFTYLSVWIPAQKLPTPKRINSRCNSEKAITIVANQCRFLKDFSQPKNLQML